MMCNLVIYDYFVYLIYHATNKNKDKHMIVYNRLVGGGSGGVLWV